ncbi:hypothetical protein [Candidatus Mycoplasma haematominutum]|uniref:Uncharacterized protein n=1 Tax=Candidatus Mycoplasma haematominutum 'Birmingham 1' TaxID=1116213 RepID=G8C3Q1_9MOLU|nr:hypothetical protein [Candidatus Mycoplasma haematominutum]CCE66949.1 hypothetical protein MHM_04310 [Candidatus Mycoplasma haematominutum 'Birmingham 1']
MVVNPRTIVGVVGTVSGCCAVGVPLGLGAQSSGEAASVGMKVSAESSQLVGERSSSLGSSLKLQKCSGNVETAATFSFGDTTEAELCWKWKSDESSERLDTTVENSLSELFKSMWTRGGQNWHSTSTSSSWKAFCTGSNWPQWVLQVESSAAGNEYLGYCGGNPANFLDIEKSTGSESNSVRSLKFCLSNCWSDSSSQASTIPPTFGTKNEVGWRAIVFVKNMK